MYYKILKKDMLHYDMQYKEGLNVDIKPFDSSPCCGGGLFFSDVKNILGFCSYGDLIAEVTVPEGEMVISVGNKYKANKINLSNIRNLWDVEVFKELVKQGLDIHADNDLALLLVAGNGFLDVVKYLVEQGAYIHADNEYPLQRAACNGHLNVVKYLIEQGADIHADNELALRWAAENGRLKIVKYLVDQGANIHADNDSTLRWTAENGHLEVVEYLENQVKKTSNINDTYIPLNI